MKIIATIVTFIFCFAISGAQTPDKNTIKIKTYSLPTAKDYNSWDIGGNIGFAYPYTDISSAGLGQFAFSLDVTKFLSHSFALQTRFIHAKLSGTDVNKPDYSFNTTINYDLTLNAIFQFGNISFLKRTPDLALYATIGFGVIHYSPDVYIDGHHVALPGIYSQYSQPLDTMDYHGTSDIMIPIGIGMKYRVSNSLSLTAEYSYRKTNSDKLDGFYKLLSDADAYSYFGVGVTYHLGSQSKNLEWVNPLQSVYNDLYDMKEKIDQMGKDSDGDGVADLYDKEPGTPSGSKVYGDGTSVDSDGDGVPDYNDLEPFSEKNAKVDASGRAINSNKSSVNNTPTKQVVKEITKVDTVYIVVPGSKSTVDMTSNDKEVNKKANADQTVNGNDKNKPAAEKKNVNEKTYNKSSEPVNTENSPSYENYKDLPSVYFAIEEDQITAKNTKTLDYIAHVMIYNPGTQFDIFGNCDAIGSQEYNQNLAKRRAESVRNYLIDVHHINGKRLTIKPSGNIDTVMGANPMNRRVDIKVKN